MLSNLPAVYPWKVLKHELLALGFGVTHFKKLAKGRYEVVCESPQEAARLSINPIMNLQTAYGVRV